jgi:hypothetical protein
MQNGPQLPQSPVIHHGSQSKTGGHSRTMSPEKK